MNSSYNVIVAGAGIVGLSTAYTLLKKNPGLKLLIVEKEAGISRHQTGNNSGVIHSGIYYKPGSLKALNCRKGYKMLLDFADENNIKYDICGKIITAVDEKEISLMMDLYERGVQNGLQGLKILDEKELKQFEPYVSGMKGIHVPQTGIIDYTEVSQKIFELILKQGGKINFKEKLINIKEGVDSVEVSTDKSLYNTDFLITCCGLDSDRVAALNSADLQIKIIPFRGEYYKIKSEKSYLVKNLIYPVPDPEFPFLGVHYTRKINGDIEAGPNAVFAFKREGYKKSDIDFRDIYESFAWKGFRKIIFKYLKTGLKEYYRSFSKTAFTKALQRLTPDINRDDLIAGGAGVRAQACDKNGKLIDDFLFIQSERVLHVCNAPSPAATSCFAIAETISDKTKIK